MKEPQSQLRTLVRSVLQEWSDFNHSHSESNMNDPEEKKEVQIGRKIIEITGIRIRTTDPKAQSEFFAEQLEKCKKLAEELVRMHGGK